jgi:hypothetical protein
MEDFIHALLQKGGTFRVRSLSDESCGIEELKIPQARPKEFKEDKLIDEYQ